MKYKIVGWLNIVIGSLGVIQQLGMLFYVYPKLTSLYRDIRGELPGAIEIYPFLTGILALGLVGIIIIGAKLAFEEYPEDNLFKWGIVGLVAALVLGGIFIGYSAMSIITPLYSVTSDFGVGL